jgi:tetratricopeptide (TPR) repeat protein/predicted Ser/Thr protein kinase
MINKTISHYKITSKLGEGGMGVVYLAEDLKLDRQVALKFLPEHMTADEVEKERFIHEAKAASSLNHPNVTTIYEIDEHEGQLFIAMEYCSGQSLKELIEGEKLTLKKTLDIAVQICEGLTAAHKKDVVHRDIKSDNIMVTTEGRVKIMDFGLAKLKGATKLTSTGSTLGTVSYMSPEQAQAAEVDQRSDIFSFGVVLYEMITGHLPFGGDHEAAVIYSIVNETPEPLARYKSNVPEGLQRIVEKALIKDRQERYQHIDGVLADLRHEKRTMEYATAGRIPSDVKAPRPKKTRLPVIIPVAMILLVIVLFFILKPFQVKIAPQQEAVAEENSLAIMYFENLVDRQDPERLGEVVTNLLITDLSESQYTRVVSSQRLYDILKLLGKEGVKVIDRDVASDVANKAEARWMLLGSILQVEPQVVLTSQLVDVSSGKVMASQRITGESGEQIFSLVDKLTIEVKKDLLLPTEAQQERDPKIAEVTTYSPEAYRYYLEGVDNLKKYYFIEAEKDFRKALEFDSTFAMAYNSLSRIVEGSEQKEMIVKALKHSDKVSQKERYYIRSREAEISRNYAQAIKELQKLVQRYPEEKRAFLWLGSNYGSLQHFEEAVRHLHKAIEIDPLYKVAYNMLAYTYDEMGDFENSIWAINQYIKIAPDEANPYDSRADLYAYNGKLDQAIESYGKALEIKPDFYTSLRKLGHMHRFKREYAIAESCYKELSASAEKDTRSRGRTCLALIPLYQGKLQEALKVLNDGITADRMEQAEGRQNAWKHLLKASIYEEKKSLDLALQEAEICREILKKADPEDPVNLRDFYVYLLVESGKIAEAEEVARALEEDIEGKNPDLMYWYWLALGFIEQAKGDLESAVTYTEKAAKEATAPVFQVRFSLASVYLKSGRLGEAVSELEEALLRYDDIRTFLAIRSVKAYYLLGLAYERSGWTGKAIEQYEIFLDIWKDADEGIEVVGEARDRLKELKIEN